MKKELAKLEEVDLKKHFGVETNFTQWLSSQENLYQLSQEIGINIKFKSIQPESKTGKFFADIYAVGESADEGSGSGKIVIENQLGKPDHKHLGQLITYASGVEAGTIIWIVGRSSQEHQKAIEWLNEHTDDQTKFFMIKLRLVKIEDSNPAPIFEIVAGPNEWARTTKKMEPSERGEKTRTQLQYLQYWTHFKEWVGSQKEKIPLYPLARNRVSINIDTPYAHVDLITHSLKNSIACELHIMKNEKLFAYLRQKEKDIVNQILKKEDQEKISWGGKKGAQAIIITKKALNVFDPKEMKENFKWFYNKFILFKRVFGQYIKEFESQK